jgi:hypothetical protein
MSASSCRTLGLGTMKDRYRFRSTTTVSSFWPRRATLPTAAAAGRADHGEPAPSARHQRLRAQPAEASALGLQRLRPLALRARSSSAYVAGAADEARLQARGVLYRHSRRVSCQSRQIRESIDRRFPELGTLRSSTELTPSGSVQSVARMVSGASSSAALAPSRSTRVCMGSPRASISCSSRRTSSATRICDSCWSATGQRSPACRAGTRAAPCNVTFLPPQPREVVPALLASADIAVVPLERRIPVQALRGDGERPARRPSRGGRAG